MTKSIIRRLHICGVDIQLEAYATGSIVLVLGQSDLPMTTATCTELSEALSAAVDDVADLTDSSTRTAE